jgi:hypothetical protein
MSLISLNLPKELTEAAALQAKRAGMSVDQYLLSIVSARIGAQAEAERYFAARAQRATPEAGLAVLSRIGNDEPPQPGDEVPPDLVQRA